VTLAPWGPMGKGGEVEVNRDVYYSHPRGEQVTVYLRPGFFKIPWYSF
jgi:hypothetical protein